MPKPNVLCIAIDGWHAGYVGAYGNTQFATPGVDRWAAAGVVCDQAMVAGDSGFGIRDSEDAAFALARQFSANSWRTKLVSDSADMLQAASHSFDDLVAVPSETPLRAAEEIERTQLFRFFASLGDTLSDAAPATANDDRPFFLFAHAQGMNAAWDAPYGLRRQILDEDDPDPPRDVSFPARRLPPNIDPDELLGLRASYAGQIAVLDECLAALDDLLAETGLADQTLVALVGLRGFPLGEHGVFGLGLGPLHEELLHVPWIMRFPGNEHATVRLPQLVTHTDLLPTLLDACGLPVPPPTFAASSLLPLIQTEAGPWRDRVCHRSAEETAITTPAWRLRKTADRIQLFVKPDDRWEVNDVSSRCGDIAELLEAAIEETEAAKDRGEAPSPLEEKLREGL